jgi:hypothetical protein
MGVINLEQMNFAYLGLVNGGFNLEMIAIPVCGNLS